MQDLIMDVERVCLEDYKLQNKYSCSELRHEEVVENLKRESYRSMIEHQ